MNRRPLLIWLGGATLGLARTPVRAQQHAAAAAKLPSIAVLDFEIQDDHDNPDTKAAQQRRLKEATAQLQEELRKHHLYRVVDPSPSAALQSELRGQQAFVYRCPDCIQQVGKLLGVDLVMATWVQKVSELILNVNVEVHDVKTGKSVLSKSVDMRGNNDVSWQRAVSYLVQGMADKRAKDAHYGM